MPPFDVFESLVNLLIKDWLGLPNTSATIYRNNSSIKVTLKHRSKPRLMYLDIH